MRLGGLRCPVYPTHTHALLVEGLGLRAATPPPLPHYTPHTFATRCLYITDPHCHYPAAVPFTLPRWMDALHRTPRLTPVSPTLIIPLFMTLYAIPLLFLPTGRGYILVTVLAWFMPG